MKQHLADYGSWPIEIADGEEVYLYDESGKKYLDFLAGWCVGNVGWKRKEVLEAIKKEAERGVYVPPVLRFKGWEEFAAKLVEISPNKKLNRAFRCTSGSEAVEFAIKCARAATGKKKIVSIDGVYQGHTYGAMSVGDACVDEVAPCVPGFIKLSMPNPYRVEDWQAIVDEFESLVKQGDVAAFMSEPVWTNAGSIIPPKEFYPAIEKICRKYDVLLVMDEVATGFGRCGALFASELWGIEPDILCLGKGMTGGYATMGATLVTEEIFEKSRGIPSYSTFGWLVQDLAATHANVDVIVQEKLWKSAKEVGEYLLSKLKKFESLPYVGEVRGIGLLLGIEIVQDKQTKLPDWKLSQKLQKECAEAGLILETAGHTLFITPPLILTKEQADEGLRILEKILK